MQKRKKITRKKNLLPKIKVGTLVHDLNMDHLILCIEDGDEKLLFIQGEVRYIWPKNHSSLAAVGWLSLGFTYILTSPPTFLVQFWAEKNPMFEESNEK